MNRMTVIVALTCGFAITTAFPALTQENIQTYKGPHEVSPVEGIEQDARIDKAQREREEQMRRQQGRSSVTSQPQQPLNPAENLGTPREDLGR